VGEIVAEEVVVWNVKVREEMMDPKGRGSCLRKELVLRVRIS
jgi:hypothetical protein